ncbi:MAG TPA: c-type cytochrome, partial [Fimbriimonadaceae bacterium]|nr:c-type cytochrome [Fimbriimonadaceae bacterium]
MAVGAAKKNTQTGLQMNMVFFGMSVVVLIVMIVTMWKDTHPAWLAYQDQFAKLERRVLTVKRADLLRQLDRPDYASEYLAAKARFTTAKDASDAASSQLESTEADLEEVELRLKGPDTEGGASEPAASTSKPQSSKAASSSSDMADLDKALSSESSSSKSEPPSSKSKPSSTKPPSSDSDMADLDKQLAAEPQSSKSEPPSSKPQPPSSKSPSSNSDMADLDKALSSEPPSSKSEPPASNPQSPSSKPQPSSSNAQPPSPSFEEADLSVDQVAADARLQAAQRDLLEVQRVHNREMIGLPKDAADERKDSDLKLREAQVSVDVAKAGVELERRKAEVKTAAQVARWAADADELGKLKASDRTDDQTRKLNVARAGLDLHRTELERDLRLVESRLEQNHRNVREIQQVYVPRLGAVDRCQSCHLAIDDPAFADAPQPFRTHPGRFLQTHAIEKFGCASCHGGFGNSLEKAEAHGQLVGKGIELKVGERVEASCGKCHNGGKDLSTALTYLSGQELFKTSGCLGCHKVDQLQQSLKAGPSLDSVAVKVSAPWLVKWLQNPRSHSVEARMPNLGLTLEESQAISAYLLTQYGNASLPPAPTPPPMAPADMLRGRKLTESLGCLGCHTINGKGSNIGPELTNVRAKVRPDWLYAWLLNPRKYLVNSRMPNFNLTRPQAELIGNYLLALGENMPPVASPPPNLMDAALARHGGELIAQRGCAGCHDMKGFARLAAPDLTRIGDKTVDVLEFGNAGSVKHTAYDWLVNKVLDPSVFDTKSFHGRMPKFGLDLEEAKAIGVYLTSLTSNDLPAEFLTGLAKR